MKRISAGRATFLLAFAVSAGAATSCAGFNFPQTLGQVPVPISPPRVTFTGATLVQSPPMRTYAAYYCPDLINAPLGTSGLVCQQFFGARPDPTAMQVAFDLHFHVANPNQVPVPVASALAAATVFPAAGNESLGALCISLCPPDVAGCVGGVAPTSCEASSRDVRSMNDFVDKSLPSLLISAGVAVANGQVPTFTLPPLSAASEIDVTVRYAFGPEQLLRIMRDLANQSVGELKKGRLPTFTIPYRLEGTVFFDAGSIGRLSVGWGPVSGVWQLPVDGIVASAGVAMPLSSAPPSAPPPSYAAPPAAPAGAPPAVP
ncbi:MAG TPA: hypothetical protein VHJ20_16490 [Polyangia bacterium]|nr:hypothetical protein [Polyangia bacterium]